ncbi:MAG: serine hydrolase [Clostridia bacterium]|nr:serine hydrolase [Clostridia bacterium]
MHLLFKVGQGEPIFVCQFDNSSRKSLIFKSFSCFLRKEQPFFTIALFLESYGLGFATSTGIVRHQYLNSTRDLLADEILSRPLAYEIGADYRYSCSGIVLLGFILEKIYGNSLEKLFVERLKKT